MPSCRKCGDLCEGASPVEDVWCPNCELRYETDYDESWDPETGEEWQHQWIVGEGTPCTRDEWEARE